MAATLDLRQSWMSLRGSSTADIRQHGLSALRKSHVINNGVPIVDIPKTEGTCKSTQNPFTTPGVFVVTNIARNAIFVAREHITRAVFPFQLEHAAGSTAAKKGSPAINALVVVEAARPLFSPCRRQRTEGHQRHSKRNEP